MRRDTETIRQLRDDATTIFTNAIRSALPGDSVRKSLVGRTNIGPVTLVAIGKAAWTMAEAAVEVLSSSVQRGLVLTKYGHSQGEIPGLEIMEAGHPIPDKSSVISTERVLKIVEESDEDSQILLLLSGGGSALFERPMDGLSLEDVADVTNQLLAAGADIVEINTIRKRLSAVKGGRFAEFCGRRPILAIVLSDVIGDRVDSIASGPVSPDPSSAADALEIVKTYQLSISDSVHDCLQIETPKMVNNCEVIVAGSVEALCASAADEATSLGYHPLILTTSLNCEAREAGRFMAALGSEIRRSDRKDFRLTTPCAMIAGGETVVRLKGNGRGGRNQEFALAAAIRLREIPDVVVVSIGSDGTDGPTDAAGGVVDGKTAERIVTSGIEPEVFLDNNDSYNALHVSGDLVQTGPTGTNVNDLMMVLCR